MIFLRKVLRPGAMAFHYATGIFQHDPIEASLSSRRDLDQYNLELLSRAFSATALVPEPPADSAANDLTMVADDYTLATKTANQYGSSIQVTNTAWGVRSFLNNADFYYVAQEVDYHWGTNQVGFASFPSQHMVNNLVSGITPTLIQPSPETTTCTVSTNSGVNWNIGGAAGWNQLQGLNATLTGGVSVNDTQTITCPQITINNQGDSITGQTQWSYQIPYPNQLPQLYSFYNKWVWEVPFNAYGGQQEHHDRLGSPIVLLLSPVQI